MELGRWGLAAVEEDPGRCMSMTKEEKLRQRVQPRSGDCRREGGDGGARVHGLMVCALNMDIEIGHGVGVANAAVAF